MFFKYLHSQNLLKELSMFDRERDRMEWREENFVALKRSRRCRGRDKRLKGHLSGRWEHVLRLHA